MKLKIQSALIFIMHCCAYSQSLAQLPARDFYFNHIKKEQGLSNGIINDMAKDKNGFLWIATLNGLNCFDGNHVMTWKADPAQPNQLYNDAIYAVCADSNSNIWCTTNAGISRYNRIANSFNNYNLKNAVSGKITLGSSSGIICTRKGEIVTYASDGIYIYNKTSDAFMHYPELKTTGKMDCEMIVNKSFIEDPFKNGIWIGTDKGLKYFNLDSHEFYSYRNNPEKISILNNHYSGPVTIDNSKNLVFADAELQQLIIYSFTSKNISTVSCKSWKREPVYFNCILTDNKNNYWMSADNSSVYYRENSTGITYQIKHQNHLSHSIAGEYFISAIRDNPGTIYLGTTDGISLINPERNFISIYQFKDSITADKKYYLHQLLNCDKQNNIWFAPSYQFVLKFNPADQTYKRYDILKNSKGIKKDDINISTMEAARDKLYFGTTDGVLVYDVNTDSFSPLNFANETVNIKGRYILCMQLSSENELWFTSHRNGIYRYNTVTGTLKHYINDSTNAQSFSSGYIFDMYEDHSGIMWFCSETDGLLRYNSNTDNFTYITKDKSAAENEMIYSISGDDGHNLWLLSFLGGLMKFDTKTNLFEKERIKALSNFRYNHLITDNNKLWLSYYSEYSVMNLKTGSVKNFEIDFARSNNDYVNYFCKMNDGRIVAESKNSFFIFDPSHIENNKQIEPVTISGFTAGQTSIPFLSGHDAVELNANQNFFSVSFSTLSFTYNNDIQFEYKLTGVDDDWVPTGNRQTAYFTNINGGQYTFHVRAKGEDGIWQESAYPLRINIEKRFYYTTWFRTLILILLLLCLRWYVLLLKKRAIKKNSEQAIKYFANSVIEKNKVEDILWDITHNVITRTDFVDCVIYLLDTERNVLIQKAAYGDKSPEAYKIINAIEIPLGKGIVGNVALSGKTEVVNNTVNDERYIVDDESRLSEIAVPMMHDGKIIGVIDSEHPKRNFFTKDHVQILETIASICSSKIAASIEKERAEQKQNELLEVSKKMTELRLTALQAQMNPHFIFNCLNVIDHYILKHDSEKASHYLNQFAKLIRQILNQSQKNSITLAEEIKWLKIYIELEKLNIENGFEFITEVSSEVDINEIEIPPLLIQPFIENAIIHGLAAKKGEKKLLLKIIMTNNMLQCIVEDNGIGRKAAMENKSYKSSGYQSKGLEVTEERISILKKRIHENSSIEFIDLTDDKGNATGTRVVINIPIEF